MSNDEFRMNIISEAFTKPQKLNGVNLSCGIKM